MNLEQALEPIGPVVGLSSLIGAPGSVSNDKTGNMALVDAQKKLTTLKTKQSRCGSDYAYWGYEGQIAYWKAIVDILMASEITGPDNLPDVNPPDIENRVVMDACYAIEQYGATILKLARSQTQTQSRKKNEKRWFNIEV